MNFRNISIRSRFFLLVTGSVLFWLLAGFLIFSLINNLTSYQDTSLPVQSIPQKLLSDLKQDPTIINNRPIIQKVDRLIEYLTSSDNYFETMINKSRQRGWDQFGLSGAITEQISEMKNLPPAGICQEVPEILRELELYLVFPRTRRMNSIENKVFALENMITLMPPNDIDANMLALQRLLKDKPYSGVIRRTKPTREEVWIMSTFTPVKDENGNIYKIYLLGQDITERKLKYQLLEEANNDIDRLNRQLKNRDNT